MPRAVVHNLILHNIKIFIQAKHMILLKDSIAEEILTFLDKCEGICMMIIIIHSTIMKSYMTVYI